MKTQIKARHHYNREISNWVTLSKNSFSVLSEPDTSNPNRKERVISDRVISDSANAMMQNCRKRTENISSEEEEMEDDGG